MAGSPVYTQPLGSPDNGNSVWTPADGRPPWETDADGDMGLPPQGGNGGTDAGLWSGGYPVEGGTNGILGDLSKWWDGGKGLLNLMPGSDGKSIAAGLMIPAWMAAYQSWQDAGKYKDTAKEAMKYGDPFGPDNREYYQHLLKQSYEHPEEFLNDPGHQAKRKSGIDAVSRADASKGYLGSGNMEADLAAYVTNLDNQYLSDERKNLHGLTGAQFDPVNAGKFLMQGNEQEIQAKNAALQALMYPFAMNMTENHITNSNSNPNNTNNNGKPSDIFDKDGVLKKIDWGKFGTTPDAMAKEILKITGGMGGTAAEIWAKVLSGEYQDISPSTRSILQSIAEGNNGGGYDVRFGPNPTVDDIVNKTVGGNGGTWGHNPFGPGGGGNTNPPVDDGPPPVDENPPIDSDHFWNFDPDSGGSIFDDLGEFYDP